MKKNNIKKVIGWILILQLLPLMIALTTLNGQYCYHGRCEDVIPFWGGYAYGIFLEAVAAAFMGIGAFIIKTFLN